VRPYLQKTRAKTAGGVAQAVERLLSKCEALSSKPSPDKKNYTYVTYVYYIYIYYIYIFFPRTGGKGGTGK
jgi:hypothetical protein